MQNKIKFNFFRDEDGEIHCWNRHMITPDEVKQAFLNFTEEGIAKGTARYRIGKTNEDKELCIIFKWDKLNERVFIITAY